MPLGLQWLLFQLSLTCSLLLRCSMRCFVMKICMNIKWMRERIRVASRLLVSEVTECFSQNYSVLFSCKTDLESVSSHFEKKVKVKQKVHTEHQKQYVESLWCREVYCPKVSSAPPVLELVLTNQSVKLKWVSLSLQTRWGHKPTWHGRRCDPVLFRPSFAVPDGGTSCRWVNTGPVAVCENYHGLVSVWDASQRACHFLATARRRSGSFTWC